MYLFGKRVSDVVGRYGEHSVSTLDGVPFRDGDGWRQVVFYK